MKKLMNTLYVTNPEAYLHKEDDALAIRVDGKRAMHLPFHLLENIIVFGYLGCSPAVLGECAQRGISITFVDERGRFLARMEGPVSGNVILRRSQYRASDDPDTSLRLAKRFIAAKIHNTLVVLKRYMRDYPDDCSHRFVDTVESLKQQEKKVFGSDGLDHLRGLEGDAAHIYFSVFDELIRVKDPSMRFSGRSRRPPLDPANALLSLFYSILSRDIVSACESVGMDPQVGFLHRDRPGRASLALDIMEELRAYYVDRFALSLINRKQVSAKDFATVEGNGVFLRDEKRKEVLGLWQNRKQEQITHPYLKEKMALGLLPYIQVQLLSRFLRGDLDDYPAFLWR